MNSVLFSHPSIFTLMNINRLAFERYPNILHENAFQLFGTNPHVIR